MGIGSDKHGGSDDHPKAHHRTVLPAATTAPIETPVSG